MAVFRVERNKGYELKRVLRSDGTFWLNIADTYCGTGNKGYYADPKNPKGRNGQQTAKNARAPGCKQKDLIGIPWLLAFRRKCRPCRACYRHRRKPRLYRRGQFRRRLQNQKLSLRLCLYQRVRADELELTAKMKGVLTLWQ